MPNPREYAMGALVERYGLHGALHALVEICYGKAADLDRTDPNGRKAEQWKLLAQRLTAVEAEAAPFEI